MKRVLVVEDEESIAWILRYHLEREGFQVAVVPDGEAALADAATSRPDLVILDLLLPTLSGWDVAERLRARPATTAVPILALSIVADRERGLTVGVTEYMTKPFAMGELLERVRRLTA